MARQPASPFRSAPLDKLRACPVPRSESGTGLDTGANTEPYPAPALDSCDGFLLSQERRWNHVVPAQAGTQRGEVECRGLSRVPGMDSCFRRKDGGTTSCPRKRVPRGGWSVGASHASQGWIPAFAGKTVGRRGEMEQGLSRVPGCIPAFAGMVAGGLTLTLPGQASLALHGGAVRAAPADTSADCAVSRKPCPPAAPLRCVSGSWGSPSATGRSGRTRH